MLKLIHLLLNTKGQNTCSQRPQVAPASYGQTMTRWSQNFQRHPGATGNSRRRSSDVRLTRSAPALLVMLQLIQPSGGAARPTVERAPAVRAENHNAIQNIEPTGSAEDPATVHADSSRTGVARDDSSLFTWEEFLRERARASEANPVAQDAAGFQDNLGSEAIAEEKTEQPRVVLASATPQSWFGSIATLFLGLTLGGLWLGRKAGFNLPAWLTKGVRTTPQPAPLSVLAVNALTTQTSVAVVEVRGLVLVLGVTPQSVRLLTQIPSRGPAEPIAAQVIPSDGAAKAAEPIGEPVETRIEKPRESTTAGIKSPPDFGALLNQLASARAKGAEGGVKEKEHSIHELAPVGAEVASDDLAWQIMRKMKTLKRIRTTA